MEIIKVKNRSTIFRFDCLSEWNYNIQLIKGNRYNYIIDTGVGSGSMIPVMEYIKEDKKPIILINTHYHWDHIWGNHCLKDCLILAHAFSNDIILEKWEEMLQKQERYLLGDTELCLPNLVFEKELYFPEDHIRVIYTPGHTIDSISVLDEEEKVLNVGDNIGDSMEEIITSINCNMELYLDTLLRYKSMDFDTCVSGHNVVLGKEVIDIILKELK